MPTKPPPDLVRDLLSEAGAAILDKTRTLSSAAVPEAIRAAAEGVGTSLPARADLENLKARGNVALDTIWSGLASIGERGSAGFSHGWTWIGRQAEEALRFSESVFSNVGRGRSSAEVEALLQDALRKHDALIRDLQDRNAASTERLTYLHGLLVTLEQAMRGLVSEEQPNGPDHLVVLAAQRRRLDAEIQGANLAGSIVEGDIERATALVIAAAVQQRISAPEPSRQVANNAFPLLVRSWDQILAEARADCDNRCVSFDNLLTEQEQRDGISRVAAWRDEFAALHHLTPADYATAGVAGVLAALADIFLVRVPHHPGFMGIAGSDGGWLSNVIKDGFGQLLPADTVRGLERAYAVPYDASTSVRLRTPIAGLGPRTHRLHSLGHDPLLGWFFGVRDVLAGGFTAIGADGSIVVQAVDGCDPVEGARGVFGGLAEALTTVGGHMLSDVATSAGLPPPLFGAFQLLDGAMIGDSSIAEITRAMYRSGYDFRHFLAGGVCAAVVEVVVRTAFLARDLHEGRPLAEALPVGTTPRLGTTLFLAHGVAAAINGGKVAITGNPLAVNYAQWLAFFRYLVPQLHWLLVRKPREERAFVGARLDCGWAELDKDLGETWRRSFAFEPMARL
ncbi:hypothetical protein [Rhodoplanes roseus]|uniref:Uncharacterized protein n=1 Tax=Rhodoplanes roseus TaxID=29409 RepID=A0A327L242_9BRAD|nr:hypothetical protein [Rhodoplanes roseus]RAI44045.1 hypothetical protein CH341_11250 [Rhodoplanes roseus]